MSDTSLNSDSQLHPISTVLSQEKSRHLLLALCCGVVVIPPLWLLPTKLIGGALASWLPMIIVGGLWLVMLYWGFRLCLCVVSLCIPLPIAARKHFCKGSIRPQGHFSVTPTTL